MVVEQFTKKIPILVANDFKYKFLSSRAFNSTFGNVRMYKSDVQEGDCHLITIDNVVYVIPVEYIKFIPKHGKFDKEAALISFNNLVPFNDSFYIGKAKEFKKNEFTIKEAVVNTQLDIPTQLQNRFNDLVKLYKKKAEEYVTDSWDSNFVKGANFLQTTKEEVLLGYVAKHIVSITDIVKGKPATKNVIEEKIGDIHIYFALLEIMLKEKVK